MRTAMSASRRNTSVFNPWSCPQAAPIRDIICESMPDARKNVPGFDAQTLEFEGAAREALDRTLAFLKEQLVSAI